MEKIFTIALLLIFISGTAKAIDNNSNKNININDNIKRYETKSCDDFNAIYENFKILAEKGDLSAKAYLSYFYYDGECNSEENKKLASKMLKESLAENNRHALYLEGVKYRWGVKGYSKDTKKAFEFIKRAADAGFITAQYTLAELYWNKYDAPYLRLKEDKEKAISLFKQAADKGNAEAQYRMGIIYLNGFPLPEYVPDYEKAFKYFTKAAKQGHTKGSNSLARIYARGYRITRNLEYAVKLVEDGAYDYDVKRIVYVDSFIEEEYKIWKEMINCEKTAKTISFGIKLKCSKRDELREAIKNLGGHVISENDNNWGDEYDPSAFLPEAKKMYVMYSQDNHFSQVFYTLDKKYKDSVYRKLSSKYGPRECQNNVCKWKLPDGVSIELNYIWDNMRLTYDNVLFTSSKGFSYYHEQDIKEHSNKVAEYKKNKLSNQAL